MNDQFRDTSAFLSGRGHPMFQPTDARSGLTPADTRRFGNGVVRLRYTR